MNKKTIQILIIIVCFIVAGVLAYTFIFSSGGPQISSDVMTWVKCNNPACGAEYEMGKRKYYEDVEEKARANPLAPTAPPLTCQKCGKNSIYHAIKCENCGNVFIEGISGASELSDRCPKCKHSAIEDSRKARLGE